MFALGRTLPPPPPPPPSPTTVAPAAMIIEEMQELTQWEEALVAREEKVSIYEKSLT
jgi:hypothetical protein